MWIFCCGMIRSGSTLQYQITGQLVEEAGLGKRIAWTKHDRFTDIRKEYADYGGWKVFKTHEFTDEMAAEFTRQNARGVYIYRDLRDVFASIMRKNLKKFDQLWNERFLERCLYNYKQWTSLPHMLISKYEDVINNLPAEVESIAKHLDIPIDAERCNDVASNYSLQQQKKRIEAFKKSLRENKSEQNFDPHTLLHTNHIHSGSVGGWKDSLTPKQVAMIEAKARDWFVENGYTLAEPKSNFFERIFLKRH